MESFTKQAYEEFVISADFVNVLETDDPAETISTADVTAMDNSGVDATDTVLDDETVEIDESKVNVLVKAGSNDEAPYKITFRCTTSNGNKWELDVRMLVKEL